MQLTAACERACTASFEVCRGRPRVPLPAKPPIHIGASRACQVRACGLSPTALISAEPSATLASRACQVRACERPSVASARMEVSWVRPSAIHGQLTLCIRSGWLAIPTPVPILHQVVGDLEALIIFSDCIGTGRCYKFAQCGCMGLFYNGHFRDRCCLALASLKRDGK